MAARQVRVVEWHTLFLRVIQYAELSRAGDALIALAEEQDTPITQTLEQTANVTTVT